jgi:hypothetical protein
MREVGWGGLAGRASNILTIYTHTHYIKALVSTVVSRHSFIKNPFYLFEINPRLSASPEGIDRWIGYRTDTLPLSIRHPSLLPLPCRRPTADALPPSLSSSLP